MNVYRENTAPIAPDVIRCTECGREHPDGRSYAHLWIWGYLFIATADGTTPTLFTLTGDTWTLCH